MTATEIATQYIRNRTNLTAHEQHALTTDDGLTVHVDLNYGSATTSTHPSDQAIPVAVWQNDDGTLIGFTNPQHPDDGEEWHERPQPRYLVTVSDAVATQRTSDNTSAWSDHPITKDELVADLADLDAADVDWYSSFEVLATITNPNTDDRERVFFTLQPVD